jgi:hypothetical protein
LVQQSQARTSKIGIELHALPAAPPADFVGARRGRCSLNA